MADKTQIKTDDYAPIKGRGDLIDSSDLTPEDELIFDRINGMTPQENARSEAEGRQLFEEAMARLRARSSPPE